MSEQSGKVALITGGGSGIGEATARHLAAQRFRVILIGRRSAQLARVAEDIRHSGGSAAVMTADLTVSSEIRRAADAVRKEFDRVDALVNCAGAVVLKPFEEIDFSDYEAIMAINVRAPFFLTQRLLPALRASATPAVVNVGSIAAMMPRPTSSLYGTSKAALHHLTTCLAAELAGDGIRVNAVAPGPVDTEFHTQWAHDRAGIREHLAGAVPMGRIGTAGEVARWIGHLLAPEASWLTGTVITLDGGKSLGSVS